MKHFLIILLLLAPPAYAQDESVDPHAECAAVLAAPPFVDVLTRNEGRDFSKLSTRDSGEELFGLECSVDEITEFFEKSGWELLRVEEIEPAAPFGNTVSRPNTFFDTLAFYCLKGRKFLGIFSARCVVAASVAFHDGRITQILAGVSK